MYFSIVLIFLFAALTDANNIGSAWNWGFGKREDSYKREVLPKVFTTKDMTGNCTPIQSNEHERIRCRKPKDVKLGQYNFDPDCCAGSDASIAAGRCANGFTRTETKSCSCPYNDCKEYTCTKSTSCVEYVGCYRDQEGDPELRFNNASQNFFETKYAPEDVMFGIVSICSNYCRKRNFSFAAVQGDRKCSCGHSYPSNRTAEEKLCGKDPKKVVAMSCGDGDAKTCAGVNAVYRLTGTEYCCDYSKPDDMPKKSNLDGFWSAWAIYLAIYISIGVACGLFWVVAPNLIGFCIWRIHVREQKKMNEATQAQAAVAASKIRPSKQDAGLPTVVYDQL